MGRWALEYVEHCSGSWNAGLWSVSSWLGLWVYSHEGMWGLVGQKQVCTAFCNVMACRVFTCNNNNCLSTPESSRLCHRWINLCLCTMSSPIFILSFHHKLLNCPVLQTDMKPLCKNNYGFDILQWMSPWACMVAVVKLTHSFSVQRCWLASIEKCCCKDKTIL